MAATSARSTSGGPTRTALPSFGAPKKHLTYIPSQLILRFRDQTALDPSLLASSSVARAAARPGPGFRGAVMAAGLSESVMAPLRHMRDNLGLKGIVPLFTPAPVRGAGRLAAASRPAAVGAPRMMDEAEESLQGYSVVTVRAKEISDDLVKTMKRDRAIEIVERMPARWLAAAPDPQLNCQWGLRAIRWFQAKRPSAAKIGVAVLDTGVDMSHPDLKQAVSFYQHFGFSGKDIVGHGTHVSGIIGALVNNGVGVAGVANCDLMVWKIFGDKPDLGDYYVDGTTYLQALYQVLQSEARVVNLSIGGGASSQTEAMLFNRLYEKGVFVVAAMGNEYEDGNPISYPAAYKGVHAVGATDEAGRRAPFSNTGRHIFISAPGANILSTLPMKSSVARVEMEYASWNGTSMAAPYVAGAAALVRAKNPQYGPADVAEKLKASATKLKPMGKKAYTSQFGHGLLNLESALK